MAESKLFVGRVEVLALTDSELDFPMAPLSELFPNVPAEDWVPFRQRYPEVFSGPDTWHNHFGCYLLRSQGRTVLVDTGIGSKATNPGMVTTLAGGVDGRLMEELQAAECAPRRGGHGVFHPFTPGSRRLEPDVRQGPTQGRHFPRPVTSFIRLTGKPFSGRGAGHTPLSVLGGNPRSAGSPGGARSHRRRACPDQRDHGDSDPRPYGRPHVPGHRIRRAAGSDYGRRGHPSSAGDRDRLVVPLRYGPGTGRTGPAPSLRPSRGGASHAGRLPLSRAGLRSIGARGRASLLAGLLVDNIN